MKPTETLVADGQDDALASLVRRDVPARIRQHGDALDAGLQLKRNLLGECGAATARARDQFLKGRGISEHMLPDGSAVLYRDAAVLPVGGVVEANVKRVQHGATPERRSIWYWESRYPEFPFRVETSATLTPARVPPQAYREGYIAVTFDHIIRVWLFRNTEDRDRFLRTYRSHKARPFVPLGATADNWGAIGSVEA